MIGTLRRKFIAVTMLSVLLVLFTLIGGINFANFRNVTKNLNLRMDLIEASGGDLSIGRARGMWPFRDGQPPFDEGSGTRSGEKPPFENGGLPSEDSGFPFKDGEPPFDDNGRPFDDGGLPPLDFSFRSNLSAESFFDTRYFTVSLDKQGQVSAVNVTSIATVTEEEAQSLALAEYAKKRTTGYANEYLFRASESEGDDGTPVTMYIFLNAGRELSTLYNFLFASCAVSLAGSLLIFLLVVIFSKLVVRPVAESYEKQKRFITDASHEIKTPLAIIEANTEVVEMENGESEWTRSIRRQISRLSSLTEKLVFLSRMDEEGTQLTMIDIDLSEVVTDAAEGFMGSALSSGRTLSLSVAPGLHIHGDPQTLTQLVSLLLDNAMKYASEDSEITLSLEAHKKGRHSVRMIQTNAVDHIEKGSLDVLFERFYRSDPSRNSKTGGHGIGLSVAAAIVRAHGGTIHAESPDGRSIRFTILL